HQKVIEEAPAPGMDEATREAVCAAAVRAARAVDYEGAGTIEFIADASEGLRAERIWFMEMNTRLQVEHPVTEEITGVDLVEWQLRVASGEPLPRTQAELAINGWAMEARLYAEDPARGFLPSIGRLDHFAFGIGGRGRIESGVEEGDRISSFYDPMIAKLIASGHDRDDARRKLMAILDGGHVAPVRTNAGFLYECLAHADFAAGDVDTGFIERNLDALVASPGPSERAVRGAGWRYRSDFAGASGAAPRDPWIGLFNFRLNDQPRPTVTLYSEGRAIEAPFDEATGLGSTMRKGGPVLVTERGRTFVFHLSYTGVATGAAAGDGAIVSPMPGRIIAVEVKAGDAVASGQRLLTLEAMKMEHSLTAPFDGVVAELDAEAGAQVSE